MASRVLLLSVEGRAAERISKALEAREMTVTAAPDLATALAQLRDQQLVIVDGRDTASVATLCRELIESAAGAAPPILAVADSQDVEARVHLLEAGADDVVAEPIDARELDALVDVLLLRSQPATAQPPKGEHRLAGGPGRLICFAAAKGGAGTTTLAVNTALVLAEMAPGSVAIADLDMHHGQVATLLDIDTRMSTASLAHEPFHPPEVLQEASRTYAGGLTVFAAPQRPDEALEVTSQGLSDLVESLLGSYATLIVDVGSTPDMRTLGVLERSNRLAMVVTPDIPALRLLHAALQLLSEGGTVAERTVFVVNNIFGHPMIGADQIEEHLGIKVAFEVPHDPEHFLRAANEGQPLVTAAHRSEAAGTIRRLAAVLTDGEPEAEVAQPRKRGGLFGGFLSRD